jgi:hypothetical protein
MSKEFYNGVVVRGGARVAAPGLKIVSTPTATVGATISYSSSTAASLSLPSVNGILVSTGDSETVTKTMQDGYAFIKANTAITHTNSTTMENMFGKVLNVDNNSVYKFEGHIFFTRPASANYIIFGFTVSGTPQLYFWRFETLAAATSFNTQGSSLSNSSSIVVTNSALTQVQFSTHVSGFFATPTTGTNTFSAQFAPGSTSQPTIDVGSWLTVEKIGTYNSANTNVVGDWV